MRTMISKEQFESLAFSLGVSDFDLMIVADGSGTVANKPCGYYEASYYRPDCKIFEHSGACSCGTNNFAELSPFLLALWQFNHNTQGKIFTKAVLDVLCVSDSELTVKCGNKEYTRSSNAALWASLAYYESIYDFTWKWVSRNSNPINKLADVKSRANRMLFDKAS